MGEAIEYFCRKCGYKTGIITHPDGGLYNYFTFRCRSCREFFDLRFDYEENPENCKRLCPKCLSSDIEFINPDMARSKVTLKGGRIRCPRCDIKLNKDPEGWIDFDD